MFDGIGRALIQGFCWSVLAAVAERPSCRRFVESWQNSPLKVFADASQ
jgi:hypothetical protein